LLLETIDLRLGQAVRHWRFFNEGIPDLFLDFRTHESIIRKSLGLGDVLSDFKQSKRVSLQFGIAFSFFEIAHTLLRPEDVPITR
jgi:hypothetical protein